MTQRFALAERHPYVRRMLAAVAAASLAALVACAPAAPAYVKRDYVHFYPACGNETLQWDGVTYYQYVDGESIPYPEGWGPMGQAAGVRGATDAMVLADGWTGVGAVVAPGPGDDSGYLTIFTGGIAYFQSDSGDLRAWLTTRVHEYNWEC